MILRDASELVIRKRRLLLTRHASCKGLLILSALLDERVIACFYSEIRRLVATGGLHDHCS